MSHIDGYLLGSRHLYEETKELPVSLLRWVGKANSDGNGGGDDAEGWFASKITVTAYYYRILLPR
jgi:hypothetical protein